MAEEAKTFDVYDENDNKIAEAKTSPVLVEGLKPNTKYSGWKLAYTGNETKVVIPDFTTLPLALSSFTIDNLSPKGTVGESVVLTANSFLPDNATNKGLKVSVDDKSVATVVDNKDNTYTVKFVNAGTTAIHWVAKDGGGAKANAKVTVTEPDAE